MQNIYYHVVTERPMQLNQEIIFNETHRNGVYGRIKRVNELKHRKQDDLEELSDFDRIIMQNPSHWQNIANREIVLEEVRKSHYLNLPSRLACLYVSTSLEDAKKWAQYFIEVGRATYQIVELKSDGNAFTGDAHNCWYECPSEEVAKENAHDYWSCQPNKKGEEPVYETIIDGHITVVRIIETFQSDDND